MPSREERADRYNEPQVGPASGGHLAPEPSVFAGLDDPLPSEVAGQDPSRRFPSQPGAGLAGERTETMPRRSESRATPPPARRQQVRKRGSLRRVKRTIRHIDPFSVLKLSVYFYAIFLIVWLVVVAIIYSMIESAGVFETAEDFGRSMVLWEEVNITLGLVEKWALLIGVVFGIVGSLLNTLLAVFYNIGADLLGGLELTFVERDT